MRLWEERVEREIDGDKANHLKCTRIGVNRVNTEAVGRKSGGAGRGIRQIT